MRFALPTVLALPVDACMTTGIPEGGLDAPDAPPAACDATEAQQFIGRNASDSLGRSILAMADARTLRWGGPNTAFTMDYREDRVNVVYDGGGTIERIYCG